MKTAIFFIAFVSAAWSLPKGADELQFKRLYVDPLEPVSEHMISRIVSGSEVAPNSIPYQAYIIISGLSTRWICSGSLISPRYVLTAATCLIGGSTVIVYLGAHNINLETESARYVVTSNRLLAHENYDGATISNDIGLIEFMFPIPLTETRNTVSLPSQEEVDFYVGLLGRVSGWGLTNADSAQSPVLLAVNSTVISNRICNSYFGIVQDHQVCISGAQGGGTCNGDSGSPLIVGNVQIGIASYGAQGCLRGYPSAFTRTDSFVDWIVRHTDLEF